MKLSGNRFVIIGRAGMDFYPDPPGTKTELATNFFACLGGSSANIGVAICKLGGAADLVTCVSDDAIGRFALNQLDHYGIGRQHVRSVGGEARNSLAVVETTIEDHQSVIYRNGAADFEMTEADVAAVDYAAYDALITTGTVFAAEPSRSAAFAGFERARAAGLPLIFDIDYRPYSWPSADVAAEVYSRAGAMCDVIVGNDVEFGFMAGDYDKGLDKARALVAEGAQIAVYKMGEAGRSPSRPRGRFAPASTARTRSNPRARATVSWVVSSAASRRGKTCGTPCCKAPPRPPWSWPAWAAHLPCQAVQNSTIFSKRMTGQARPERT
jgi:5-dehydro-2-deoxygluconokinase